MSSVPKKNNQAVPQDQLLQHSACRGEHWEEGRRQGTGVTEQGVTTLPWGSSAETNARPLTASAGFLFLLLLGN